MNNIRIYETMASCQSGITSAVNLAEFKRAMMAAGRLGAILERYNFNDEPEAFGVNDQVAKLLVDNEGGGMPYIFIDEELKFSGVYPTEAELVAAMEGADSVIHGSCGCSTSATEEPGTPTKCDTHTTCSPEACSGCDCSH